MPRDIIAQIVLSKLNLSAAVSRPALRVQMQGPTDVLSKFMEGLDALSFFGEWPASAGALRKIPFSLIHRPRSAVVRVRAHPKDAPVSADELAFRLRLRLLEEEEEAERLSFDIVN